MLLNSLDAETPYAYDFGHALREHRHALALVAQALAPLQGGNSEQASVARFARSMLQLAVSGLDELELQVREVLLREHALDSELAAELEIGMEIEKGCARN